MMKKKYTFSVVYNGCESQQCEVQMIRNQLLDFGFVYDENVKTAEIVLAFCCTFTAEREKDSILQIQRFQGSHNRVIASGCLIPSIMHQLNGVENAPINKLVQYLLGYSVSCSKVYECASTNRDGVKLINIASGCVGSCSYCSIKQARGRIVSRPVRRIVQEMELLPLNSRVRLVAQDVSAYGYDIGRNLPYLLFNIWDKRPDLKVELGNLNILFVKDYSKDDLNLFHHVHGIINLPIQSASDDVLRKMNRGYCFNDFAKLYDELRCRQCMVSTDIMAGFPSESIADHELNIRFLSHYYFDFIQVFMYELRPGTKAERLPQINQKEKEKRTLELIVKFLSTYQLKNGKSFDINNIQDIQSFNTNLIIN